MNVEIRIVDSLKGKALFATKGMAEGSVIFEEDPLVSCQFSWNAAYGYKACHHCMRPLETAQENARRLTNNPNIELPYPECCTTKSHEVVSCAKCGELFCSVLCQEAALDQYHKILCLQTHERNNIHPLEQLNEAWKQIHYPPETSTIFLIVRMLAKILQSSNKDLAQQQILGFCHRSINEEAELAHKFLGAKFADQLTLLHNLLLAAIPKEGIEQFLTPQGFQSLLALIGTNGQGVGTSPFSQWTSRALDQNLLENEHLALEKLIDYVYEAMDTHSGSFLNNEGVALYVLQSACNHSCTPNAEVCFLHNNHRLSLVALKDIEVDEEICISYLDECSLNRSRHSRTKQLMENYLFACNCPKCQAEAGDPDVTSEEEMSDSD
ncbi:histone-lysine N-trimethyltransferase SMYD5 [Cylas formicarius]|uniref:histone-lysine N-trimethyltransferase SMYD5 n=1 Tax=Cylas formicarius TaxID=197179 RepID=UPI002958D43F|nr:histone-lysine N-trimethyltransferase SMYD5 [Cylas formicarius]